MGERKTILKSEKIVFILGNSKFTEPAILDSANLRSLIVSGTAYAKWSSHQQSAIYSKDENIVWKFIK